ncbi:hypothetical protein GCM10020256_14850 [Streptomyces thermocoprophilus]
MASSDVVSGSSALSSEVASGSSAPSSEVSSALPGADTSQDAPDAPDAPDAEADGRGAVGEAAVTAPPPSPAPARPSALSVPHEVSAQQQRRAAATASRRI